MRLRLEGVSFAYGNRPVLRDVTTTLSTGEFVCILGPNGAGKTTLFRLVTGELTAGQGRVELQRDGPAAGSHGHDTAQSVAVLPQGVQDPPYVTVRELVALARSARRNGWGWRLTEEDHDLIGGSMVRCGIGHMSHRPFDQLSGGEKQRVWLAFCLAQGKEFLLLDEPLHAQDFASRRSFFELLAEMAAEGRGVIITTHELGLAGEFADRLLVLRGGRLTYDGPPPADVPSLLGPE